jgi:hypothetical protein
LNPTLERVIPGMIGLGLVAVPTAYLSFLALQAWSARGWPTAQGRVVRSAVVPGRRGAGYYDVRYEYQVDGRTYGGDRVRFGGALNGNLEDARLTRDTYPEGRPVEVRYHPRRPRRSTLEPRASGALWLWIGLGLLMSVPIAGAVLGFWS